MNNLQLYLAIGIPTITVILAWLSSRADNHRTNDKIDRTNEKVDRLSESLRGEIATLRADMNKDMTALRAEIGKDFVGFRREMHQDMMILKNASSKSKPSRTCRYP